MIILSLVLSALLSPIAALTTCEPGIISTPTYGTTSGVFTVCAATNISAPASSIYDVVTDFASYHEWNSFVINVTSHDPNGQFVVGTVMTFTSAGLLPLNQTAQSDEVITSLDEEQTTAVWRYDSPTPALMWAEHVSEITELEDGEAAYVSWESYYGVGSVAIQLALEGKLQTAFEVQGSDLKRRVEAAVERRRGLSGEPEL